MADQVITKQELIDAQKDAQTLEDVVNGAPDQLIETRLGRQVYTLASVPVINTMTRDEITEITDIKADKIQVISDLSLKADKSQVSYDLSLKANTSYVDSRDLLKADKTYVDSALAGFTNGALKFYPTLALANADIANITTKDKVDIGEVANGGSWYKATASATTLTKSPYDSLVYSKQYTDSALASVILPRNRLADNFLYTGVLTNADDLNPLTKDGVYVATSTPLNSPEGETGQALIKIERHSGFVVQTWQRIADSRRIWRRTIQTGQTPEVWRDLSFLGSANIATASKVGTVKPSTGLTVGTDGTLSVSGLLRPQLADDFTYVGGLNATNDLNTKLKEGSYLTVAVPLNAPAGININVLVTIQNVGQRYIQTIYDLVDSRKRLQRVIRFNDDGSFNSAETWRDLNQVVRSGLADSFLYAGVLTSVDDLNSIVKDGVYVATSVPINAPTGAPSISFINVSRAGAFVRQTLTDGTNALKNWSRNFQIATPISGGVWVSSNPADNLASPVKAGSVKVGTGLEIKPDGTLNVIAPTQANIFAGKKIVCFGDSITEFKTYPQQVGTLLGAAEGINVGFGGCMMAAHWDVGYKEMCMYRLADYVASGDYSGLIAAAQDVYTRTGDDNRAIAARLAAIDWNTVDYITILYGTNDFANGKSIGVATDIKPDGSNYLGSANYAIQRILTTYPHLKIAFITPIYRARGENGGTDSDDSLNATTNGRYLRDFCTGLIEVAKLNHIPCFNLHDESGINKYTASLYLNPAPDGVHLTEAGATFLAQKIAAKMRANF